MFGDVRMIKNIVIKLISILIKLFYICPIRKNVIVFVAYHGKSYSCSPKYISEFLYRNCKEYKLVWSFDKPDEFSDLLPADILKVKYKSVSYIYYTMTAGIRINNAEEWIILPRRKGQLVINTWHGGGAYKKVGFSAKYVADTYLGKNNPYNVSNLFLSSCGKASQYLIRDSFHYSGDVLGCGL